MLLQIIKHQKLGILLITGIATIIAGWFAIKQPDYYKSTVLLNIVPIEIVQIENKSPSDKTDDQAVLIVGNSLNDAFVKSTIKKHSLFQNELSNGVILDELSKKIYRHIEIESDKSENYKIFSLRVSYYDNQKDSAINVTTALASELNGLPISIGNRTELLKVNEQTLLPTKVIHPKWHLTVTFGFISGLLISLLLVGLLYLLRNQRSVISQ
jgi:capsular polysaccharide biosynthesis protein